jgi:hypothetical protein
MAEGDEYASSSGRLGSVTQPVVSTQASIQPRRVSDSPQALKKR